MERLIHAQDTAEEFVENLGSIAKDETAGDPAEWLDNFAGGGDVSDNPNRFLYFPSHKIGDSEPSESVVDLRTAQPVGVAVAHDVHRLGSQQPKGRRLLATPASQN